MSSTLASHGSPTHSERVLDDLRADIINGTFAPLAKLAMKDLTLRYRVGLSPIREALQRLVAEGFVQWIGQRGFRVPPLSLEDLDDLTRLRLVIEQEAVRQAIARGGEEWEAGIVAAFHRLERRIGHLASTDAQAIAAYDSAHRAFHVALYAGGVSPRLQELQSTLFDQAFRYRRCLHGHVVEPAEALHEHRALMRAVMSRDVGEAVAHVTGHLRLTLEQLASHWPAMRP